MVVPFPTDLFFRCKFQPLGFEGCRCITLSKDAPWKTGNIFDSECHFSGAKLLVSGRKYSKAFELISFLDSYCFQEGRPVASKWVVSKLDTKGGLLLKSHKMTDMEILTNASFESNSFNYLPGRDTGCWFRASNFFFPFRCLEFFHTPMQARSFQPNRNFGRQNVQVCVTLGRKNKTVQMDFKNFTRNLRSFFGGEWLGWKNYPHKWPGKNFDWWKILQTVILQIVGSRIWFCSTEFLLIRNNFNLTWPGDSSHCPFWDGENVTLSMGFQWPPTFGDKKVTTWITWWLMFYLDVPGS